MAKHALHSLGTRGAMLLLSHLPGKQWLTKIHDVPISTNPSSTIPEHLSFSAVLLYWIHIGSSLLQFQLMQWIGPIYQLPSILAIQPIRCGLLNLPWVLHAGQNDGNLE